MQSHSKIWNILVLLKKKRFSQVRAERWYASGLTSCIIVFILFILKVCMLSADDGPTIFKDELLYRINALAIFNGKKYANAHYPPLYPLALSPAFLFQDWYRAMHVLNAFWSSLLVPAAWFLGRTVGLRRPVLAGLLVAVIPFQAVYFRLLMSENLFLL